MNILVGNTFPLTLIRRKTSIVPKSVEILKVHINDKNNIVYSFWGHNNTLATANKILEIDLTPTTKRPSLLLSNEGYIEFNDNIFKQCWVLSPDYIPGFRPIIGEEVGEDEITGWQVLQMIWE